VFAEDTALDEVGQCDFWAESGECSHNPRYMLENCGNACRRQERIDREIGRLIDSKISHIGSFFQLEAEDIDGNTVSFEQFRGKVTVITNVASYCGKRLDFDILDFLKFSTVIPTAKLRISLVSFR